MRSGRALPLLLLLLAVAAARSWADYGQYDYVGYGDDDDSDGWEAYGADADAYGYYDDADEAYYEYYGYYTDDFYGDYYDDGDSDGVIEQCTMDVQGLPMLANGTASCDIRLAGVDKQMNVLSGGLDGVYQLMSCYNGQGMKAGEGEAVGGMYKRKNSPIGEERLLWYSSTFGDWDVSEGSEPDENKILMYGGEMEHAAVPLFVNTWHLSTDTNWDADELGDKDYLPISVKVSCADGKVFKPTTAMYAQRTGPMLTAEEIEAKYRQIYTYARSAAPRPTVNPTLMGLLVMACMVMVAALPLLRRQRSNAALGSISFAQMLSQHKKKEYKDRYEYVPSSDELLDDGLYSTSDEYGYYGDEAQEYYEEYGYYDAFEDYGNSDGDDGDVVPCVLGSRGKPVLTADTPPCDIRLTGVDKQAGKGELSGALDGVYQLSSCHNGKPMYTRKNSPIGEERVLWYSSIFGDWDVSEGSQPEEDKILMYGGEMEHAAVPLFVGSWHLGSDSQWDPDELGEDEYRPVSVKVSCADGKVYEPSVYSQMTGPVLTAEEIEAKYRHIYGEYKLAEPSPTVNPTLMVLLVMACMVMVTALPLLRRQRSNAALGSTSFAQMLSQHKKKEYKE
ncbi:hypothetical protein TSOC_010515 [Tetrabaena socialis]|uniref:Uncharacterized protein n=1 Tax=Tetrabaena socialis TaxID=47790 RepID=A0A2J7ZT25_9CHLO|nr:hypothetical protein TSOC_010515 [Tetrabaena socialis]|eukprot:PNH03424.1 hypothetical protein TSOC_010515 [Tetrabaena socialis]